MVEQKPRTEVLTIGDSEMQPALALLYDYWSGLAAPGGLPRWGGALGDGFRLIDLPTKVLAILAVVDVGPDESDFVYRYWGSERWLFLGDMQDPTGRTVMAGLTPLNAASVLAQYREVYRSGKPILLRNTWALLSGLSAECQTLRLPLSKGGDGVGMVVAATAFLRHAAEFRKMHNPKA